MTRKCPLYFTSCYKRKTGSWEEVMGKHYSVHRMWNLILHPVGLSVSHRLTVWPAGLLLQTNWWTGRLADWMLWLIVWLACYWLTQWDKGFQQCCFTFIQHLICVDPALVRIPGSAVELPKDIVARPPRHFSCRVIGWIRTDRQDLGVWQGEVPPHTQEVPRRGPIRAHAVEGGLCWRNHGIRVHQCQVGEVKGQS